MSLFLLWWQLFVATCSPSRDSSGSYAIWGHSTLVGPVSKFGFFFFFFFAGLLKFGLNHFNFFLDKRFNIYIFFNGN